MTLDDLEAHAAGLVALTDGDWSRSIAWPASSPARSTSRLAAITTPPRSGATARAWRWRARAELPLVATNDVRYARPAGVDLCDVLTCIREKTTLDDAGTLLAANAERHLKSAAEMRMLFRDLPDAVDNTLAIAARCAFTLEDLGYRFPHLSRAPTAARSSATCRTSCTRARAAAIAR